MMRKLSEITGSSSKVILAAVVLLILNSQANADRLLHSDKADSLGRQFELGSGEQVVIPEDASLSFYFDLAMKRSPALRSAFYQWKAAIEKTGYAGALPDPMFSFAYFVENVQTRVGPQEERLGLKQSFPWFGTLGAKKDVAIGNANASYSRLEATRLQLLAQVKAAYLDLFFLGQELQITEDNLELLKFWESVARSKYTVGLRQHPDVIKAQVELGKLDDELKTLQESVPPAAARLRALLNLTDSVDLPIPDSVDVAELELKPDSVLDAVSQNNPNLEALNHIIDREEAGTRLAGKLSMPSLTAGVDYIVTGEALIPDLKDSGKDPWMVGVGLSLPIWFGKNRSRTSEAHARLRTAEYNLQEKRNQILAYTQKVLFDYSDALRKTRLYRDGLVPKAEESLNASYASYQAGKMDFLNVLDAQRQLLDFQLTVEREKVRLGKNSALLEMLTGNNLERFEEEPQTKE